MDGARPISVVCSARVRDNRQKMECRNFHTNMQGRTSPRAAEQRGCKVSSAGDMQDLSGCFPAQLTVENLL